MRSTLSATVVLAAVLMSFASQALSSSEQEAATEQWARDFFHSFNDNVRPGRLDHWLSSWADDAERITPMGNARGKTALYQMYSDLIRRYRGMGAEITGLIVQGHRASVELMMTGMHKGSGVEVSIPNVALLTFDAEGKVSRARVYFDMKAIDQQIAPQQ